MTSERSGFNLIALEVRVPSEHVLPHTDAGYYYSTITPTDRYYSSIKGYVST
jgi:hypothetical protein